MSHYERTHRIPGFRRNQRVDGVQVDYLDRKNRIALFIDGCFWHWCDRHMKLPDSNRAYWWPKLLRNALRDINTTIKLEALGWRVTRIWEHDLE